MSEEILFKYRSMQNWKFLLDILLEGRMYAATYKELNDPMEGRYYYHSDRVSQEFKRALRNQKREWRICSLSRNHRNTLMWSYYADGHRGIAIGATVRSLPRKPYLVRPVSYDMEVHVGSSTKDPAQVALEILSQKQFGWQHEDEVRVFTRDRFVHVDIRKVCFGLYTSKADRDLVAKLVELAAPGVEIVQLKRRELDQPLEMIG